jgi:hypothetical protein
MIFFIPTFIGAPLSCTAGIKIGLFFITVSTLEDYDGEHHKSPVIYPKKPVEVTPLLGQFLAARSNINTEF